LLFPSFAPLWRGTGEIVAVDGGGDVQLGSTCGGAEDGATEDQNPALQLAALKRAGCRKTFKDERTGATAKRPALLRCLKALQNGDTLIVWKLDRLARSLRDLVSMLDDFHQRGIYFRSLTEEITPPHRAAS
jgi:DNA invertase Pin-like site-specific DNA recombinase